MRILYQAKISHLLEDLPLYTSISSKEVDESVRVTYEYGYSSNAEAYVLTFSLKADLLMKTDKSKALGYSGTKRFAFKVETKDKDKERLKVIIGDLILNARMYIQDNTSFYLTKPIDTDLLIQSTIQSLDDDGFYKTSE